MHVLCVNGTILIGIIIMLFHRWQKGWDYGAAAPDFECAPWDFSFLYYKLLMPQGNFSGL